MSNTWRLHGEILIEIAKIFRLCVVKSDSSHYVRYVNSNGNVNYNWYNNENGVRPFWNGRRSKVREIPKSESHYQKNTRPFLPLNRQDKYKGVKYYDRR